MALVQKRKATDSNKTARRKRTKLTPPPYIYDTLGQDEIRVLVLSPGSHDDPLAGRLETVSLDDQPQYRAISYVWGPALHPFRLQLSSGELKITESLHGALRNFRSDTEHVGLWADAVCINQGNTEERGTQVNIMADIYREAVEVLVWLGEAKRSDTMAFWMIEFLGRYKEKRKREPFDHYDFWRIKSLPSAFHDTLAESESQLTCHCCQAPFPVKCVCLDSGLGALASLWKRSWFTRLWVVQEVTVSVGAVFHCGRHQVSMERLKGAAVVHTDWLLHNRDHLRVSRVERTAVERARQVLEDCCHENILLVKLMHSAFLFASEPRDRIYAIRAITYEGFTGHLTPDYSIELPKLWQNVAIVVLQTLPGVMNASVLALAAVQSTPHLSGLPSWVPNLEHLDGCCRRKIDTYQGEVIDFHAGGQSPGFEVIHDVTETQFLSICGKKLWSIQSVLQDSQFPASPQEDRVSLCEVVSMHGLCQYVTSYLLPWYYKCHSFTCCNRDTDKVSRREFRILLRHGFRPPDWTLPFDGELRSTLDKGSVIHNLQNGTQVEARQIYDDLKVFLRLDVCSYRIDLTRIMARTAEGHLGWVPKRTRPGDRICLFAGAPFPFIIRDAGSGYYEIVGDAYIHGIMSGEAWPDDETETEIITLK